MNKPKLEKTKQHKLLLLRFHFEGHQKNYTKFREDPINRFILEAIDHRDYKDFIAQDIIQYIKKDPKAIEVFEAYKKTDKIKDEILGKIIGSRLGNMVKRSMLEVKSENPEIRQKTFGLDRDVAEKLKSHIKKFLNKN